MNVAISPGVARGHHRQVVPVVLHELDQGVDGLTSEVGFAAAGQRVGLVDQQHAAERLLDHGPGLDRRLADVAGDEERAIGLDEVALREHAERSVDAGPAGGRRWSCRCPDCR